MISSVRSSRARRGPLHSWRIRAVVLSCLALVGASRAHAVPQSAAGSVPAADQPAQPDRVVKADTPDATREELAALLEQQVRRTSDASLREAERTQAQADVTAIRRRLDAGDFVPGDRFAVTVVADTIRRLDMLVRDGPSLDFSPHPPLPLAGVLRAELPGAIHQHLSRFYRNPEVRVQFLTRVTISGAVARPGSYPVPPFVLVSDVISQVAGGPSANANTDKIVVNRGGKEIVSEKAFQQAVKDGYTVERLGLQPGDEIRVGERARRDWRQMVMIGMFSVSIFTAILALIRSSYAE